MSKHVHYISLPGAIFININIMLSAGVFINTTELAQRAGALGALSYLIIGILMLPLILSIAHLLSIHPAGGFYIFGQKEISPFVGFISSWAYFTGKLASATLTIHMAVLLIQKIIPSFTIINTLFADTCILALFIALNTLHIKTGGTIQLSFIFFKAIPIIFLLLSALFLLQGTHLTTSHHIWHGIPSTLPLVLYATLGFEAACSLSSKIRDAHKNAPRAVLISYGIVILIASLYQLIFYGILDGLFAHFSDFRDPFPALLTMLLPHNMQLGHLLSNIMHLAIAVSALGGGYGIIFSNNWNLYTLAQHGHTFAPSLFTKLNRHHIPWVCVLIEGIICALYLIITRGHQIPLQQISALGCIIAYTLSVLSLIYAKKNRNNIRISWLVPLAALGNCFLLTISCVYSLFYSSAHSLITFSFLLAFGVLMFWYTAKKKLAQLN